MVSDTPETTTEAPSTSKQSLESQQRMLSMQIRKEKAMHKSLLIDKILQMFENKTFGSLGLQKQEKNMQALNERIYGH